MGKRKIEPATVTRILKLPVYEWMGVKLKLRSNLNNLFVMFFSKPYSSIRRSWKVVKLLGLREGLRAISANLGLMGSKNFSVAFRGVKLTLRPRTSDLSIFTNVFSGEFDIVDSLLARDTRLSSGEFLSDGAIVVDAGAHIGTSSVALAKKFPDATVLALEPDVENFRLLEKNSIDCPNIIPLHAALVGSSHQHEFVTLFSRNNGYQGFTVVPNPIDRPGGPIRGELIRALSLAQLERVVDGTVRKIGFLKMDIEGGELQVILDDKEKLLDIPIILIELHQRIVGGELDHAFSELKGSRATVLKDTYDKFLLA